MRDRMVRGGPGGEDTPDDENTQRRSRSTPGGSRRNREDEELQKALEASKRTAELEAQKTALSAECVARSCPDPTRHLFSVTLQRAGSPTRTQNVRGGRGKTRQGSRGGKF